MKIINYEPHPRSNIFTDIDRKFNSLSENLYILSGADLDLICGWYTILGTPGLGTQILDSLKNRN